MAIETLVNFKSSYADLPKATAPEFPTNLADWFESNISGLELDAFGTGMTFTFDKNTLISQLSSLPTTPQPEASAITALSNCFLAALTSSTWQTQIGTFLSMPSLPANTFGAVTTTTPLLTGVAAKIQEMIGTDPKTIQSPDDSPFPEKIREAVLTIKISTVGFDSTPAPSGPIALADPNRSIK